VSSTEKNASPEPGEPDPDECLMGSPWPITQRRAWESEVPTPEDCVRVLHFFIDDPAVLRQIGLARRFLQANRTDSTPRWHYLHELKAVVERWAGERISRSALLAALEFEGCGIALAEKPPGSTFLARRFFVCYLSLPLEIHATMSAFTQGALDHVEGALACVP
jgi:hypothetical protein